MKHCRREKLIPLKWITILSPHLKYSLSIVVSIQYSNDMEVSQNNAGMMDQGCCCNLFVEKNLHDVLHDIGSCHVYHDLGVLSMVCGIKQVDVLPDEGDDCHVAEEDENLHFQELAENVGLSVRAKTLVHC